MSRDDTLFRASEAPGANRKKALLRILATREAERLGIAPSDLELTEFAAEFRALFGLAGDAELAAWLDAAGLPRERFDVLLRGLFLIGAVEDALDDQIELEAPDQRALWTAHEWLRSRREPAP